MVTRKQFSQWIADENAHFEGWDFSYLNGRMKQEIPEWNYINIAKRIARGRKSVLDIDTGGGESYQGYTLKGQRLQLNPINQT